ncbi:MAG TPA: helix-turn-helix domain-containing protein [Magnetospirillaceae bacterium]|nr:helix-turn-helix domain-containing protein [Magnetospirillaceae bacterium]
MSNLHKIRSSGALLVKEVRKSMAITTGKELITPDGCWDIMVYKHQGSTKVMLVSSPLVSPAEVPHFAGQEMLVITFEPGAFIFAQLPLTVAGMHELSLVGKRSFWLGSSVIEIPNFENADTFADRLRRDGFLINDTVVENALVGKSDEQQSRTRQRHFRRVMGMSLVYFRQIERANAAADRLRRGSPILQVAHDLGYSDQFHMANSLRRILGQTPSALRRATKPL